MSFIKEKPWRKPHYYPQNFCSYLLETVVSRPEYPKERDLEYRWFGVAKKAPRDEVEGRREEGAVEHEAVSLVGETGPVMVS